MFGGRSGRWNRGPVGLFVALALVVAAAGLVASPGNGASAVHVPPTAANVETWLGVWHTNFGTLHFYDAYRVKVDTFGIPGNPDHVWRVDGIWAPPGKRLRHIHGIVDSRDYQSIGGCWGPNVDGNPCSASNILIFRHGHQIYDGYWKQCLPCNYGEHGHPWRGERVHGDWVAGFRFTQRGRPDGHTVIATQTGGAGKLIFDPPLRVGTLGFATTGSGAFHIDEVPGAPHLTLTIKFTRGTIRAVSFNHRRTLELVGKVTATNDPRKCAQSEVNMRITEGVPTPGRGTIPDRIALATGCFREQWTSADRRRVNVHIEEAHETR